MKYLEESSLESSEGTADSQVELLPGVYTLSLVFIWLAEIVHSCFNILVGDGRKVGSKHILIF